MKYDKPLYIRDYSSNACFKVAWVPYELKQTMPLIKWRDDNHNANLNRDVILDRIVKTVASRRKKSELHAYSRLHTYETFSYPIECPHGAPSRCESPIQMFEPHRCMKFLRNSESITINKSIVLEDLKADHKQDADAPFFTGREEIVLAYLKYSAVLCNPLTEDLINAVADIAPQALNLSLANASLLRYKLVFKDVAHLGDLDLSEDSIVYGVRNGTALADRVLVKPFNIQDSRILLQALSSALVDNQSRLLSMDVQE